MAAEYADARGGLLALCAGPIITMDATAQTLSLADPTICTSHPWLPKSALSFPDGEPQPATAATLLDANGQSLGSGLYDPSDPLGAWRRFSWGEEVAYDEAYIAVTIHEALGRRGEESCRRLISSDADYLPGLIVEQFEDLLLVELQTAAVEQHQALVTEILKECFTPQEMLLINQAGERRTLSGNNLKGRWIEVDGLSYRIDPLNAEKPRLYLDQREQYSLVGSLCEGRHVLDCFAHSGAFALQAMHCGAEMAVAVDNDELCTKGIGANAQKNGLAVEAIHAEVEEVLDRCDPGAFDAIVFDPPEELSTNAQALEAMHRKALSILPSGGVLATYCRGAALEASEFDQIVSNAAATSGREGRIFARISQPFDFPVLLNLPESRSLKGLILQVE